MEEERGLAGDEYVFLPGTADMRIDYPELNKYPEFGELSAEELKFVWFFSNPTSPVVTKFSNTRTRIEKALYWTYGNDAPQEIKEHYKDSNFPPAVMAAIEVMKSFKPSYRSRANAFLVKSFDQIMKMLEVGEETDISKWPASDKKDHLLFIQKANSELPLLIENIEMGFGVKKKGPNDFSGKGAATLMDIAVSKE